MRALLRFAIYQIKNGEMVPCDVEARLMSAGIDMEALYQTYRP